MLPQGAHAMPFQQVERPLIHVLDDDAWIREALVSLFDSIKLETRTYATARDFLASKLPDKPGCVVLDIRLPDMNGLDFHERLTELGVLLPVVIMTGHGSIPLTVRAMKRGVVDFLQKPFDDQVMIDAVVGAIERDRQRRGLHDKISQIKQRFGTLTAREHEVMLLATAGKMNK